MFVIKRDGRKEEFNKDKIKIAVEKASKDVGVTDSKLVNSTIKAIEKMFDNDCTVDEIHNAIEKHLMQVNKDVAKSYIIYRQHRTDVREANSSIMDAIGEISGEMTKDNANTNNSAASKMYGIAEVANKQYVLNKVMKPIHSKNHKEGRVYANDLGYYQHTFNCFYNPIEKMLEDGFNNGVGNIRTPKRIGSAMALVAIILQSSQNSMFGGQGVLFFDTAMAKYAKREYEHQCNRLIELGVNNIEVKAMQETNKAVYQACEAFVFNMNTMRSRSGRMCATQQ